jgi:hypothetical protein
MVTRALGAAAVLLAAARRPRRKVVAADIPADNDGYAMNSTEPHPACDQLELVTLLALGLGIVVGFVGTLALSDYFDQSLSLFLSLSSLILFLGRAREFAAEER